MSKSLVHDVDRIRKLQQQAAQNTRNAADRAHTAFWLHDIERRELDEYLSLSPQDHAAIMQEVGEGRYREYVESMERLRTRYGR